KVTTEHRVYAERPEVLPCHPFADDALGVTVAEECGVPAADEGRRFDGARTLSEVHERFPADAVAARTIRAALVHGHETLGMRERKPADQHRVHDAEDRRRRADGDAEREHAEGGEAACSTEY